ncbi:LADA_0G04346g1_1 [Lachancea dasiensis]|uniref:LADA_0G04346g1_1 n=1 Tax=Lachancea dasiensis TaxID=1072105 RepID=A0A1G4JS36_9SACH|nr:LADA_0G04346g1_1 [Lachancea dasiensis]
MERAQLLPNKKGVGVQLGFGIRNSGLYISTAERQQGERGRWIHGGVDDFEASRDVKLHMTSKERFIDCSYDSVSNLADSTGSSEDALIDSVSDSDGENHTIYESALGVQNMSALKESGQIKLFKNVQLMTESSYDTKVINPTTPSTYVPGAVIKNLETPVSKGGFDVTSTVLRGSPLPSLIVDPTSFNTFNMGPIHTTTALRMNRDANHIVAFASGETLSLLNVGLLDDRAGLQNPDNIVKFDLNSKIKNIVFPRFSAILNRASDCFAVITTNSLCVFQVRSIDLVTGFMQIDKLEPLHFHALEDLCFADVSFNPWDFNEFAVVDVKGNWAMGNIVKKASRPSRLRLSGNKRGSVYDPEDISSFHQVTWGAEYFCLILISRSNLIELNLKAKTELRVIEAKSWSTLRDFKRINDQFCILTTSKEIILISFKGRDIERVISWKHCLDPADITFKSEVRHVNGTDWGSAYDELFFVFITSSNKPQVLLHVFAKSGPVFQSIGGSSILQIGNSKSGISSMIAPQISWRGNSSSGVIDPKDMQGFCCFVREADSSAIWRVQLSKTDLPIASNLGNANTSIINDSADISNTEAFENYLDLQTTLPSDMNDFGRSRQEAILQQYGYEVSEATNKLLGTWNQEGSNDGDLRNIRAYSIYDLAPDVSAVENMEELGSLLQQFQEHYQDQEIWFGEIAGISSLLVQEEITDLEVLYNKLLQCWAFGFGNDVSVTKEIVKAVILKSLGVCSPSLISQSTAKVYEQLPEKDRELIDLWEDSDVGASEESFSTSKNSIHDETSQMSSIPPSVKSSQPKSSQVKISGPRRAGESYVQRLSRAASQPVVGRPGASKSQGSASVDGFTTLPDAMTPAFSLTSASQPVPTLSKSVNSRRQKKKKKLGGFG